MKVNEVFGDSYDFLFLFEHSNCTVRIEKTPTEWRGYYTVGDTNFVAKIEIGNITISDHPIKFINFAFGMWDGEDIHYTLQNNPNVNQHTVLGCANKFLTDNLAQFADADIIVFAATYNNYAPSEKYKTAQDEVNARMRVYNLMARQVARAGGWGIMAEDIVIPNGKATLIRTKNIEHISTQTIIGLLKEKGKI